MGGRGSHGWVRALLQEARGTVQEGREGRRSEEVYHDYHPEKAGGGTAGHAGRSYQGGHRGLRTVRRRLPDRRRKGDRRDEGVPGGAWNGSRGHRPAGRVLPQAAGADFNEIKNEVLSLFKVIASKEHSSNVS